MKAGILKMNTIISKIDINDIDKKEKFIETNLEWKLQKHWDLELVLCQCG